MARAFWIHLALFSFFLILMVASKGGRGGKSKGGGWSSGGTYNPSYPGNTGSKSNIGSNLGNNYNPGGSNYNKQAGAAAVGAVGGFKLGKAVSNMRYHFDNDMDYRYYNSYHKQMPSRVYRPMYRENSYVPEDKFVTDCYNMSMTEYVMKPNKGKNASEIDQTEVRVKSTVIHQLCVTEYKVGPEYYSGSGLNLLFSPSLILFITLFVYFVVE